MRLKALIKYQLPMHFRDYFWKDGLPVGLEALPDPSSTSYKIVSDPYRKRISIEKYAWGDFDGVIYDSQLLDFRTLKAENMMPWERTTLGDTKCLIRDQNDRAILFEEYQFKKHRCIECRVLTPHGVLVGVQRLFYKEFDDAFNGVVLYDANHHAVMKKEYEIHAATNEFGELIKELWEVPKSFQI